MIATVKGKRYVYIASPLVQDAGHNNTYKCRQCVADPLKQETEDTFSLHSALSNIAPMSPDNLCCHAGFWVEDTLTGKAQATAYLMRSPP